MMKAICKKAFVGILSGVVLCAAIPVADTLELSNTTLTASAIGSRDYTIGVFLPQGFSKSLPMRIIPPRGPRRVLCVVEVTM